MNFGSVSITSDFPGTGRDHRPLHCLLVYGSCWNCHQLRTRARACFAYSKIQAGSSLLRSFSVRRAHPNAALSRLLPNHASRRLFRHRVRSGETRDRRAGSQLRSGSTRMLKGVSQNLACNPVDFVAREYTQGFRSPSAFDQKDRCAMAIASMQSYNSYYRPGEPLLQNRRNLPSPSANAGWRLGYPWLSVPSLQ